ncbi:hypothetical protein [Roseofilum casamattae]|uniref:Transposase n=1 Tax=Roseofilum casamattae BLCC-M143 TaxID=3022442 RepID=A0ABT7BQW2_9CYAN|nr:hypothetical protein [Roseofilum casamattae]MDJ1181578.1 hypothetical protein [Roseofilum casamattae BLCC-M143]
MLLGALAYNGRISDRIREEEIMTQSASAPFDFIPQANGDREILEQLGFLPI